MALFVLYAVRDLHFNSSMIAAFFIFTGIGGTIGGFLSSRIASKMGLGTAIVGSCGCACLVMTGFAAVDFGPAISFAVLAVLEVLGMIAIVVFDVCAITVFQIVSPTDLVARVTSGQLFLTQGTRTFGALIFGFLGAWVGFAAGDGDRRCAELRGDLLAAHSRRVQGQPASCLRKGMNPMVLRKKALLIDAGAFSSGPR
ncbi:MFS transporter [Streptacidiphilus sp. 4-A2]|nr:MFS transporter [Streptacidiphilus sp. 4-A2]